MMALLLGIPTVISPGLYSNIGNVAYVREIGLVTNYGGYDCVDEFSYGISPYPNYTDYSRLVYPNGDVNVSSNDYVHNSYGISPSAYHGSNGSYWSGMSILSTPVRI